MFCPTGAVELRGCYPYYWFTGMLIDLGWRGVWSSWVWSRRATPTRGVTCRVPVREVVATALVVSNHGRRFVSRAAGGVDQTVITRRPDHGHLDRAGRLRPEVCSQ